MKPFPAPIASTLAGAAALALAACAAPAVDAQWTDPQLAGQPLLGGRVLVVCESTEVVLSQLCLDRLSADLQERGAIVVAPPEPPTPGQPGDDARYLAQARAAGATAIWAAKVGLEPQAPGYRSGPGVSIGLGGFGIGRGAGVGVGVSVPVGGDAPAPRYTADARVTDAATGRLWWTARAEPGPAGDARSQLDRLLQQLVSAAGKAQLL
jgi:hypothetical protein